MSDQYFSDFPLDRAMRPTLRTWVKHFIFFALTFVTVTMAGAFYPFGAQPSPLFELENLSFDFSLIFTIQIWILLIIGKTIWFVFSNSEILKQGLTFSVPLLTILTCHEFGHYIACRIYGVDATLPYFIPMPILSPAGTFGAFIKILSPLPSRKATFDIGVAGPIAGFIALIPMAIIAFLTMTQVAPETVRVMEGDLYFSDSILMKCLAYLFGFNLNYTMANGFYFAVWVGLLITSLNLIPSGQLDGGHAIYAVFGEKIHNWTGKIAFAVMVTLSISGWYFYGSPSALLFTIILGVMLRIKHPEPLDNSPLDFKRKIIAFLTLLIFVLSFTPFPIQVK